MGLSFRVAAETAKVHGRAVWGHYIKTSITDEEGRTRRVWQRVPVEYEREVDVREPRLRLPLTGASTAERYVMLTVETRALDHGTVVEVSLVNGQREPDQNADEVWFFQPRLTCAPSTALRP